MCFSIQTLAQLDMSVKVCSNHFNDYYVTRLDFYINSLTYSENQHSLFDKMISDLIKLFTIYQLEDSGSFVKLNLICTRQRDKKVQKTFSMQSCMSSTSLFQSLIKTISFYGLCIKFV